MINYILCSHRFLRLLVLALQMRLSKLTLPLYLSIHFNNADLNLYIAAISTSLSNARIDSELRTWYNANDSVTPTLADYFSSIVLLPALVANLDKRAFSSTNRRAYVFHSTKSTNPPNLVGDSIATITSIIHFVRSRVDGKRR